MNKYIKLGLAAGAVWAVNRLAGAAYRMGRHDGHKDGHRCVAELIARVGVEHVVTHESEVEHAVTLDADVHHIPMHTEN